MTQYLFYDLETSGLNPCFDQFFQYAALTTDANFEILSEIEYRVALRPDVIPAPQALLTHQLPIFSNEKTVSELEATLAIHQQFNTPHTISLGYNTLGFDDVFLRFAFYRHLLPPYSHQYAQGCYRMDIYPMLIFYYLFQPDVIAWPSIDGKVSLKLENLNKENNWVTGPAHNALVDVRATIALAIQLKKQKDVWAYLSGYFNADIDAKRLQKLPIFANVAGENLRLGLLIDPSFGEKNAYQVPVLYLGMHQIYRKKIVLLRLDVPLPEAIATAWIIQKKWGEPGFLLPPHEKYLIHLSADRLNLYKENLALLREKTEWLAEFRDYHCRWEYPVVENLDIDAALYQAGFYQSHEVQWCTRFHRAAPDVKVELLQEIKNHHYLYPLAIRLLGRYFSEYLPESVRALYELHLKNIWQDPNTCDYKGHARVTLKETLEIIAQLNENIHTTPEFTEKKILLAQLENYLRSNC